MSRLLFWLKAENVTFSFFIFYTGTNGDRHSIQESSQFDQACVRPANELAASALMEGPMTLEAGTAVSEVAVKVEKSEQCNGDNAGQDFGSDCLSLAQSRLLDDWRPEQLQLQSNSYPSSASNTLGKCGGPCKYTENIYQAVFHKLDLKPKSRSQD